MNQILGNFRSAAARVALVACVAGATVAALAIPAAANTGNVNTAQDCYTWSASVSLNPNVTSDHFVEVMSTIPGTTGIVDGHFNTIGNAGPIQIWHVTGAAPSSGTVTLTILNPDRSVDFTTSAKLPPSEVCPTTTTLPPNVVTTTTATTTTTTLAPTTSVAPTTITLPPTSTTAPPATTSTSVSPVTVTEAGSTSTTAPPTQPVGSTTTTIVPAGAHTQSLPFTGSGTAFPALFGLSCLAGGAVLAVRRRGRWAIRK